MKTRPSNNKQKVQNSNEQNVCKYWEKTKKWDATFSTVDLKSWVADGLDSIKEEFGCKTKFWERLLFLIPNIVILWLIFWIIWSLIGIVDYALHPHASVYKYPAYNNAYSIFFTLSIIVWIIMLFIPTRKKLYSVSILLIWWVLLLLFSIYIVVNDNFKLQQELQRISERERECKKQWYSSCGEYRNTILNRKF